MKKSTFLIALILTLSCTLGLALLGLPRTDSALAPGLLFLLPLLGLVALAARALPRSSAPQWGLEARLFLHILFHAVATFLLALLAVLLIDAETSKPYTVVLLTIPLFALIVVRFFGGPKDYPLGKTLTKKVGQPLEIK